MLNETYRAMLGNKSVIRETFMYGKQRAAEIGYENVFDYSLGNPSVPCPQEFTAAMQDLLANEEPVNLHGYCPSQGDPGFRTDVAAHLTKTFGLPYEQKHIFPTTGAAGAIAHAIRAVTQPGDEVLTFAPYFPEYGPYVAGTGAVLKVVPPQAPTFQPNLDAFEQMIGEKTTCVLINTPNNPTGVVYSAGTLTRMAEILTEKSKAFGHNIFLVSDEPYRDIAFDGKKVPYPAAFYPHTLTCFSYSKSLSLPGERLGYVAVRPGCEGEDVLVDMMAQISRFTGHNCPPSIIQRHLTKTFGLPYEQKHIFPTTGAAGAIAHAIRAVTQPGDEVLTFAPYFPEYGPYVAGTGAVLKVVPPQAPTFQPNLDAFEQMIGEKTTCVLINTPNNPTGVVYSAGTLTRMAEILTEKSKAFGHNIFLVSDEPYRDIAFDGKKVPYPAAFYPHTLTCFSYSKSLSLPGERLGYVAVRPGCEGEDILVDMMAQISRFTGHNCPPSIIQRAVGRCQEVTSDLSVYETNMNLLYDKLTALGFEVERPGGTFYIFPKALEEDANAFCLKAREFDLLLVPSDTFGVKGYVRLAYCIDTEKVKRSLSALEKLAAAYRK